MKKFFQDILNYDVAILELTRWNTNPSLCIFDENNLCIESEDLKVIAILKGEINENFSQRMKDDDPAIWMLRDDFHSTPPPLILTVIFAQTQNMHKWDCHCVHLVMSVAHMFLLMIVFVIMGMIK